MGGEGEAMACDCMCHDDITEAAGCEGGCHEFYHRRPLAEVEAIRARFAEEELGGHVFHYEPATDLFRCIRCAAYEVTVRCEDGSFTACDGRRPDGVHMELNAF